MGFSADIAVNGVEALEASQRSSYDLIFMDCQMPKMDGYEATKIIRAADGVSRRPWIVAMTANAMQGDQEKCLAAGMDEYVAKPVDLGAVRALIERRLAAKAAG